MDVDYVHGGDATNGLRQQASFPNSALRSPETDIKVPTITDAPNGLMKMDIDDDNASQPTPIRTLTKGTSKGMQSDNVPRLDAIALDLPSGKMVDRLACSPRDAAVLATAGPALCRIWNYTCNANANASPNSFSSVEFAGDNQDNTYVSAMEWSPDGTLLARAIREKNSVNKVGILSIFDKSGQEFQEMHVPNAVILNLRWNPTGRSLLAIAATGESLKGIVHIWTLAGDRQDLIIDSRITDAVWLSEFQFTICGEGIVARYTNMDGSIRLLERYEASDGPEMWMHVTFDAITNMHAVIDDENGRLAILDKEGRMVRKSAHDSPMTAMDFQPILMNSSHKMSSRRILATASLDCSVRLWNAQKPTKPYTFHMSPKVPVLALAFSPDGSYLAAASSNHVQLWLTDINEQLVARWDAPQDSSSELTNGVNGHSEMNGNGIDGDSGYGEDTEEPLSLLSWAADSSRLFFSSGNKVN